MLWLKSCPRCQRGDLHENSDIHGPYVACLQCGYYLTLAEEATMRRGGDSQIKTYHGLAWVEEDVAVARAA
jgi:Zn ribbon nucleic-acid-binding protein